jgi:uncharacterized alpha-E superfamily protein
MLSRTADSLYWLARYVERAENLARIVQVAHRMASMAKTLGSQGNNEWLSTLIAAGCEHGFLNKYSEVDGAKVVDYLVRDADNPSSILACLETARHNARVVRTAITVDMWDSLNYTWREARDRAGTLNGGDLDSFLDWVRTRSQLFEGAYASTMLRNDVYFFTRLGTFLERADNTARILDVKYHVLLPQDEGIGGALDYYQWQAILRSVSALRGYHWIYHKRLQPWLIAEFLILRPEMPRSLHSCSEQIVRNLELIADSYGGKRRECHRVAGDLHSRLRYGRIEDIFQRGLHEYLTEFIDRSLLLGAEISAAYLT